MHCTALNNNNNNNKSWDTGLVTALKLAQSEISFQDDSTNNFCDVPWSTKMDADVVNKCLAFCQGLVSLGQHFSFNLSLGKNHFNFDNKELVKSSWMKKKKSPSQLRREEKRKAARED